MKFDPRPLSFYGPDDWDGVTPWQEMERDIQNRQRAWDRAYMSLSRWDQFWIRLSGKLTEPVGTSGGVLLPEN